MVETPILKWEDREREGDDVTAHISEEALLKAPIHLAFKAPNDEDTLLFYFCQALEGLPFGSLKSCDDIKCNNWFVHVSKRERKYCSQKCGMRTANRERRKRIKIEDPEKYKHELKEGRKRAKKSQKKIRAKHGKK